MNPPTKSRYADRPLRAAVIGTGYLGSIHLRKYLAVPDVRLVAAVDVNLARARAATKGAVAAYADFRDILDQVDIASIAVPTERHHEIAKACLAAGIHVLVEKPITGSVAHAAELIDLARERGLVLQVGHLERFNPAVVAMREAVTRPMFIECHRLAPFKPRGIDVNVVLDLMIHDLDIVLSLVNSSVRAIHAAGLPVLTREVDIANARIEFECGCVANLTASRASQKQLRRIRVFEQNRYISADYEVRRLSIHRKMAAEADGSPVIQVEERGFGEADPLMEEIRAFVQSVRSGTPPPISGEDGRCALEAALAISRQIESRMAAGQAS